MKITRRTWVIGLAGVVLIAIVATVMMQSPKQQAATGGGRFGRGGGDQPVPTLAAAAAAADVPVYLDGVGSVKALNTVTVRSQVDGKLMTVNFKEGQDVDRGFVLAKIDPTLYQAQYDQAVAKKAQDEALLQNQKLDLDRYVKLVATNALASQQADTQKSLVAQTEAQIKADQAMIDNARAMLDYTDVVAPITGRTGLRLVDAGNLIHASDTTGVVVLTQVRPISVVFTLPQQQLGTVNAAFAKGSLTVDAFGSDNKTVVDHGTLVVVDNLIDPATGTVKLKAEFPNTDLPLWPGQFVNVRVLVDTLKQATVVPTAAVQRGPTGTFVFVIKEDNTVATRPVTVRQQDETQTVIASGLQVGERVATTGFNQFAEGTRVTVGVDTRDQPVSNAPPARQRRNGGQGGIGQGQGQRPRGDGTQPATPPAGQQQRGDGAPPPPSRAP